MTRFFDKKVRNSLLASTNFFEDPTAETANPKDLVVRRSTVKEVRAYVATYHYSKMMPDSVNDVFMGFYDGIFAGVCTFGMGVGKAQYTRLVPDIQNGEYREMNRLWSPDKMPKNTESRLISESLKNLPKQVKLILSFADPTQGHMGSIYQATNWYYCGMSGGGKRLRDEDNKINFEDDINKISDQIRMLDSKLYPSAYINIGDYKIEFSKSSA